MKKIFFSIIALAVVAMFIISSCKKDSIKNDSSPVKKENGESYMKISGQQHNKGLDYVYQQLKIAKDSKQLNVRSKESVLNLVKKSTEDFLRNNEVKFISDNSNKAIMQANIAFEYVSNLYYNNSNRGDITNLWTPAVEDSLTVKQKELLTALNQAIDESSLENTIKSFELIRERAKEECTEEELYVIIAAIEIGENSFTYWDENLDKWMSLLENRKGFSWSEVGKVDVASGVGTAAGVGVGALFGPIGWGVAAGTVAGGAVAGSVTDAILQLW